MAMPAFDARILISKYREGNCTPEEAAFVEHWYEQLQEGKFDLPEEVAEQDLEEIWMRLKEREKKPLIRRLWTPVKIAASVVLIVAIGMYVYHQKNKELKPESSIAGEIAPGSNKAVLILADGKKVSLNDAGDGVLAKQAGMNVVKAEDGQLVYSIAGNKNGETQPLLYNTIQTPRGGKYQVRLPDGSTVWLNAVSTLKFPTSFDGLDERKVEMTGEAYFEVAPNKHIPFVVKVGNQQVKVLGTHFNINAYTDEASLNTTLVEGAVEVTAPGAKSVRLKPGQQSAFDNSEFKVKSVDAEIVVAWMNGDFIFKDENIQSIMRKLERWYDIQVVYEGKVSDIDFGAEISRSRNLSQVLKILEETGNVHFRTEGRRVTVMP